jgi:hypothetical protein
MIQSLGTSLAMPAIVISFVILLYIRYDRKSLLYKLPLGQKLPPSTWASTLSFLATISVTLVFRREGP